jgi:membrane protein required for colicin V production
MDSLNLTYFDYLILAITAYSIIAAFYKGLIKAFTSFFGWIISAIGSEMLFSPIEGVVSKIVTNNLGAICISLFSGFVISIIFTSIITNKILDLTPNIRGGMVDRSLGFAFGFLRGLIISCVIFQIVVLASPLFLNSSEDPVTGVPIIPLPDMVKNAKTYQLLNQGSSLLMSMIPKDLIQKQIDALSNKIEANVASNKKTDGANQDIKKSNQDDNALDTESLIKALSNVKSATDASSASAGSNGSDVGGTNNSDNNGTNSNNIDITDVIKKLNEMTK